jgi:nitrogen fixation NifU-like protein
MTSDEDTEFDEMVKSIQEELDRDAEATFSKKVIEEYKNPQNVGIMKDADVYESTTGECGDTIEMYLKIEDDRVIDIRFMTDGCGATIACGSKSTKMAKGKLVYEIEKMTDEDLITALDGLPDENLHCARLAISTLHRAVKKYRDLTGK